ncbi:MAG: hypothetical protein WCH83_00880 [Alphaproteobacteria bacterium]|jgi:hypothetical protein
MKPFIMAAALIMSAVPAAAQFSGGGDGGGGGANGNENRDTPANRLSVTIRAVPIGAKCVRAIGAYGFDPRLNQELYRMSFDSGPMTGLGLNAYENAFSSSRTPGDAAKSLDAARKDAASFRRDLSACN